MSVKIKIKLYGELCYTYRTANSKLEYNLGFSNEVNSVALTGNFNFNHSIMLLLGSMINGKNLAKKFHHYTITLIFN